MNAQSKILHFPAEVKLLEILSINLRWGWDNPVFSLTQGNLSCDLIFGWVVALKEADL